MDIPKKGDIIYCTSCKEDLYEIQRDIQSGDRMMMEDFKPLGNQRYEYWCNKCGTEWNGHNFR